VVACGVQWSEKQNRNIEAIFINVLSLVCFKYVLLTLVLHSIFNTVECINGQKWPHIKHCLKYYIFLLFSTFTKLNLLTSISPHHNYQKSIQFQDFNPLITTFGGETIDLYKRKKHKNSIIFNKLNAKRKL